MSTRVAGIVLAGGRSRRMGIAKATLAFGTETLIERMVRIVGDATGQVVVVAAKGQELPRLSSGVVIARDRESDCGPLEGIANGIRALESTVDAAYITACDTPLVTPAFIRCIIGLLDDAHDSAVPVVGDREQPLAGVYRLSVLPVVEKLLGNGQRRVLDLLDLIRTRRIPEADLRTVDPDLQSVRNLNTPADYQAALAAAGLVDENRREG
jgi:molybdopterin-guanine dinucleotide biosynthesis protein A